MIVCIDKRISSSLNLKLFLKCANIILNSFKYQVFYIKLC